MVEHGTTAGSQNELANILLQLLLCHLASSEVTDVKCIFSVLPSGSCLYNNRVTCRIWLRVIPRITSRIFVTQTLKWKKLTRKVLLAAGITGTDYCRWVRGSGKLYIPMFFHVFILQSSHRSFYREGRDTHAGFPKDTNIVSREMSVLEKHQYISHANVVV